MGRQSNRGGTTGGGGGGRGRAAPVDNPVGPRRSNATPPRAAIPEPPALRRDAGAAAAAAPAALPSNSGGRGGGGSAHREDNLDLGVSASDDAADDNDNVAEGRNFEAADMAVSRRAGENARRSIGDVSAGVGEIDFDKFGVSFKLIIVFDFIFLTLTHEQTSEIAVSYAVSVHGMAFQDNTRHGASITELYIAAAKLNEQRKGRSEDSLMQKFAENRDGFQIARSKFGNALVSYHTSARVHTAEILHAVFSTPRGVTATPVQADKLDAIHEMLQLQIGQALLDTTHPVCKEYDAWPGGGIRRMFPASGSSSTQVFTKHMDPHSETAQFLSALGELHTLRYFAVAFRL